MIWETLLTSSIMSSNALLQFSNLDFHVAVSFSNFFIFFVIYIESGRKAKSQQKFHGADEIRAAPLFKSLALLITLLPAAVASVLSNNLC